MNNRFPKTQIEAYAQAVVQYLAENRCVRCEDGTIPNFKTVWDICEANKIPRNAWKAVKNKVIDMGYPLSYITRSGHFLGEPGEEITNIVYKYQMARGWRNQERICAQALKRATPNQKHVIGKRFKDFEVDEVTDGEELQGITKS